MQNDSTKTLDLAEGCSILKTTENNDNLSFTATSLEDSSTTVGTLRYAIENANDGATITFADSLKDQTIKLTQGELSITKVLTIDASNLCDEGNTPGITINADGKSRVATISAGTKETPVVFKGLTLTGGNADNGGGIYVGSGSFTLTSGNISNNNATYGGGVYVACNFTGDYPHGTFTLTNGTITDNSATETGGGVCINPYCSFTLTNGTISGNTAKIADGVFAPNSSSFESYNSIIVFNGSCDIYRLGDSKIIGSHNLSTCQFGESYYGYNDAKLLFVDAANGDYSLAENSQAINVGNNDYVSTTTDLAGNSRKSGSFVDLGAYEYQFPAPLTSVSISGEVEVGETLSATAYWGSEKATATYVWLRDGVEISGATGDEYVVSIFDVGAKLTVKATGTGDYAGTVESSETAIVPAPTMITIEPIYENFVQAVNVIADGGTIKFKASSELQYMSVESSIIVENKSFTIDGSEARLTLEGNLYGRLFEIKAEGSLTLVNVALMHGGSDYGGAIHNSGTLTLKGVNINNCGANKNGGAIFNDFGGTLTVNGGVYTNNSARNGGAFANYGKMTILSTVSEPVIMFNSAEMFGGAYFGCGTLEITGAASFTNNKAFSNCGGVSNGKGGAIYNDVYNDPKGSDHKGTVTIKGKVVFSNNYAGERGGAIETYCALSVAGDKEGTTNGVKFDGNYAGEYGGAIDVGEGGSATFSDGITFKKNGCFSSDEKPNTKFGGAIFSVAGQKFKTGGSYSFIQNEALKSGGAIDAINGTLNLAGEFTFTENLANGDEADRSGFGGAIALATSAKDTDVDGASFNWSDNKALYGRCVAIKYDCGISAEKWGLSAAASDYVTFEKLCFTGSENSPLPLESISPNAVKASITVEGATTTFGAEGATPQQLGLGVGTYEALVQYVDANGETSATYVLNLTVEPGASVDVRETTIADGRGVKFDFNLTNDDGRAVSVWEISWGDGSTTRLENLSQSWMAAHYYAQDGTFDVSLKVVYLDGVSESFDAFSTQKIGSTVAKTEALSAVFEDVDDLFEDAFVEFENPSVYGPAFLY